VIAAALELRPADVQAFVEGRSADLPGVFVYRDDEDIAEPFHSATSLYAEVAKLLPPEVRDAAWVKVVPVPPLADRGFVEALTPTMVDPWVGPINQQWVALVDSIRHANEVHALRSHHLVVQHAMMHAQEELHRLFSTIAAPSDRSPCWYPGYRSYGSPGHASALPTLLRVGDDPDEGYNDEQREVTARLRGLSEVFFLDSGEMLVTTFYERSVMIDREGRELYRFDWVVGSALVQLGPHVLFRHPGLDRFAVFDLESRSFVHEWPSSFQLIPRCDAIFDRKSEATLPMSSLPLPMRTVTRDGRYALDTVGDADYDPIVIEAVDISTGVPQITLRDDGDVHAGPELIVTDGSSSCFETLAVGITHEHQWRFALPEVMVRGYYESDDSTDGERIVVTNGRQRLLHLQGEVVSAAFDHGARHLAVVTPAEIVIVDVEAASIDCRFPIPA
jgi:hypothetical protein